jgi:hypothetical protein
MGRVLRVRRRISSHGPTTAIASLIPYTVDASAALVANPWCPEIVLPKAAEVPLDGCKALAVRHCGNMKANETLDQKRP